MIKRLMVVLLVLFSIGFSVTVEARTLFKEDIINYRPVFNYDGVIYYVNINRINEIGHPYLKKVKLMDVWVKEKDEDSEYENDYTLRNYYIWPERRKFQVVEVIYVLENRGDPVRKYGGYQEMNWQKIIPDSFEDYLYRAVVNKDNDFEDISKINNETV